MITECEHLLNDRGFSELWNLSAVGSSILHLGFNKVYELEKKIPGCFGEDFKHDDLFRLSHHKLWVLRNCQSDTAPC